jgi:hypothetical protein
METLKAIYHIMPLDAWLTLVLGPAASYTLTKLKSWLALESERVIVVLLLIITALGGIATYLATSVTQTPLWIAPFWGIITTIALAFYHLFYKPGVQLIKDAKAQREAEHATPKPADTDIVPTANGAFN